MAHVTILSNNKNMHPHNAKRMLEMKVENKITIIFQLAEYNNTPMKIKMISFFTENGSNLDILDKMIKIISEVRREERQNLLENTFFKLLEANPLIAPHLFKRIASTVSGRLSDHSIFLPPFVMSPFSIMAGSICPNSHPFFIYAIFTKTLIKIKVDLPQFKGFIFVKGLFAGTGSVIAFDRKTRRFCQFIFENNSFKVISTHRVSETVAALLQSSKYAAQISDATENILALLPEMKRNHWRWKISDFLFRIDCVTFQGFLRNRKVVLSLLLAIENCLHSIPKDLVEANLQHLLEIIKKSKYLIRSSVTTRQATPPFFEIIISTLLNLSLQINNKKNMQ